ncbi:hypothetical protein [Chlamydia vaughanii]|uniref:hypothetical protein n=1 Tax=Chlamydia vaughanii TaxID=3112552 RepID=UPI0032B14EC9
MKIQTSLQSICPSCVQWVQNHEKKLSKVQKCFIAFVVIGIALVLVSLTVTSPLFMTIASVGTIVGVLVVVISALLLWLGKIPVEAGCVSITCNNLDVSKTEET